MHVKCVRKPLCLLNINRRRSHTYSAIYNIYIHKWQRAEKIHILIHNNRNTMEHHNIQNRSVSYKQSIGEYFKSIINKAATFLQQTNIIRTLQYEWKRCSKKRCKQCGLL